MKINDDWKHPLPALVTRAPGFDKWAHFAGSAAGVLLVFVLFGAGDYIFHVIVATISSEVEMSLFVAARGRYVLGAAGSVLVVGLVIELLQGEFQEDGFSFVDLGADVLGIALAAAVIA